MRKVNWGVLGTADIARGCTIPGMLETENCRLYAIAGRSLEKAEAFRREFGFEKAYGNYEDLLSDPQVEAVYLPLPNSLHAAWAIRAMEAGKHVLCEKPMAGSEAEMKEMFHAAHRCGVHLMEAFAYLHSPIMDALKRETDSGVIGNITYLDAAFYGGAPAATDIRMRKDMLGGAMYDLGCYATSCILWLLGMEPCSVQADALYTPAGIDMISSAHLEFPGGIYATASCGMTLKNQRLDRVVICGDRGRITADYAFNQAGDVHYTVASEGVTRTEAVHCPRNYHLEVEQLGQCILNGASPRVSEAFSCMNARTLDRILQAMGY